jgi:hypothetical protein
VAVHRQGQVAVGVVRLRRRVPLAVDGLRQQAVVGGKNGKSEEGGGKRWKRRRSTLVQTGYQLVSKRAAVPCQAPTPAARAGQRDRHPAPELGRLSPQQPMPVIVA